MVVMVLAACRVEGRVDVDVARDGSGTVTVAVGLDAEAVAKVGDLTKALQTSDLAEAGWKVAKPQKAGVITWVRATKAFRSPADLGPVMSEIGLFRSWHLKVSNGFGSTTWKILFDFLLGLGHGVLLSARQIDVTKVMAPSAEWKG